MSPRMDMNEELKQMKKELILATEAEEKSMKAMDELASLLREVAAEASQAKEHLKLTNLELKAVKAENEQLRLSLGSVMAECNMFKNAAQRVKMEADETLAAWNDKESGLVSCLRNVEEERSRPQAEKNAFHEEMKKLRDIVKKSTTEATRAREEASLARGENLKLEDQLAEKDTALNFISRELESLRASEAAARHNLSDLKCQLAESSLESPNSKTRYVETHQTIKPRLSDKEHKKVGKAFSFDMRCSGRNKGFEDLVDGKAAKVTREASNLACNGAEHGAWSLKRDISCRFPEEVRRSSQRQNSLRKKALLKRFGELFK